MEVSPADNLLTSNWFVKNIKAKHEILFKKTGNVPLKGTLELIFVLFFIKSIKLRISKNMAAGTNVKYSMLKAGKKRK